MVDDELGSGQQTEVDERKGCSLLPPRLLLACLLAAASVMTGKRPSTLQDSEMPAWQCSRLKPSTATWPFKIYLFQNNPSKRNPKLQNEDVT